GEFMASWVKIERELATTVEQGGRPVPTSRVIMRLHQLGKISDAQLQEFREIQRIRNEVVHGKVEASEVLDNSISQRVARVAGFISTALDAL
ncbi:MAG: hypothetical protein AAFQ75_07515, partial [Pseudomonadota bacterium]